MKVNKKHQPGFDTLQILFQHNLWANTMLFDQCAQLNDEQLNSKVIGTYGSIRDTLEHIASAERSYFHRLSTGQPYRRPHDAPTPTMAELQESIHSSGEGLIEAAPRFQSHDSVEVDWDGMPRKVPCAVILTQVINHATEHRAQIMVMMTQLGLQPQDLDGWTFFEEIDN